MVDADLALSGAARLQFVDMVNWWLRITTARDQPAPQIKAAVRDANNLTRYFEFGGAVSGTGQLIGPSNVEVNGHSLGGHLASAFARIFGGRTMISHVTTFNSAGFTGQSEAVFQNLQQLLGSGMPTFPDGALQTNYFAKNGLNFTTNSFYFNQIGQRVEVFNEEGVGVANHYIYKLRKLATIT